jgi:hypothetical protein
LKADLFVQADLEVGQQDPLGAFWIRGPRGGAVAAKGFGEQS